MYLLKILCNFNFNVYFNLNLHENNYENFHLNLMYFFI